MNLNKYKQYLILAGVFLVLIGVMIDPVRGKMISIGFSQGLIIGFGAILILIAGYLYLPKVYQRAFSGLYILSIFVAGIGVLLLLVNVVGVVINPRDPQAAIGYSYAGKYRTAALPASNVEPLLAREQGEDNAAYARRLNQLVFDNMIHYWVEDGNDNLNITIFENWRLWWDLQKSGGLDAYEFCNPNRALERGVSVCSQYSKVLVSILQADGGFEDVYPYVLEGHVVAQVLIEIDQASGQETWWVLDADYDVVLEHSVAYLEQHPEVIREDYLAAGYDEDIADLLVTIYGPEGNYQERNIGYCRAEEAFYEQKWRIPLYMLVPFLGLIFIRVISPKLRLD